MSVGGDYWAIDLMECLHMHGIEVSGWIVWTRRGGFFRARNERMNR